MAVVTGNIKDVVGGSFTGKFPQLLFTLNAPQTKEGGVIFPQEPVKVTPAANGSWSVDLAPTVEMLDDAWYTVQIVWVKSIVPRTFGGYNFPDWQLQVPLTGGAFSDLFGKPPKNTRMVYVSLAPPTDPRPFTLWLKDDPSDPANPLNTGNLYEWSKS
ncbi:hypothetical protein IRJ34_07290 [Paenarthrobacter sp. GOM3]|uniref:hypothetical protein n=1 Tax=Paenarthrobacter sp. GOM3 TaxID=2782567 RepID=UPI001BA7BE56|nr:hypothetical protein [Paenarthrobacter sp. GOM3]WOH20120.1 hypothetical protein IRJ34_07290 [Paenarthrobacter sp. GOM3]